MFSSHPFTICSSPSTDPNTPSKLVFYIRHQGGFTEKLYQHALENPDVPVPVQIDGPYGGADLQKYRDSDRLLIIAGGSGAGWILPFIERFARHNLRSETSRSHDLKDPSTTEKSVPSIPGPSRMRIVLATRDTISRKWFLRTVSELLEKYPACGVRVQVHLTGEAAKDADLPDSKELQQSSSSSDEIEVPLKDHEAHIPGREFEGRPQLAHVIRDEAAKAAEESQSLGVFVCGPDTMQNDVRNAVAAENMQIFKGSKADGVYLHSEHFSWA